MSVDSAVEREDTSMTWSTAYYDFHDLILEVKEQGHTQNLARFLQDFSCFPTSAPKANPSFSLSISHVPDSGTLPPTAQEVFRFGDLSGHTLNQDFYLQEGASILYLPYGKRSGEAFLPPPESQKAAFSRQWFWGVGLTKLLRPLGYFVLHAAGITSPTGQGILVSGVSGSGKSTLTIGMVRHGWGYLSDDAVLLRHSQAEVTASVFRQPFSIESKRAEAYADFSLGKEPPPAPGKHKRRLFMQETFPQQHVPTCLPRILLLPKIVDCATSKLEPVTRQYALGQLLAQSSPALFDQPTMADHLQVLTQLVSQCQLYELQAGQDLHQKPSILESLLAEGTGTP